MSPERRPCREPLLCLVSPLSLVPGSSRERQSCLVPPSLEGHSVKALCLALQLFLAPQWSRALRLCLARR